MIISDSYGEKSSGRINFMCNIEKVAAKRIPVGCRVQHKNEGNKKKRNQIGAKMKTLEAKPFNENAEN